MKRSIFRMPSKKLVGLVLGGLAVSALAWLYFSLPRLSSDFLVAQAEKFGLQDLRFKLVHVGWQRLDLADVTVGDAAAPALRIPELSIEYSLAGLWRKRIKNVRLAGAWIRIEDRGRGFRFPGMVTPPPAPAENGAMPTVERLTLEGCTLRLAWAGHSLAIPIRATLRSSGPGYRLDAWLRPLAETVRLQGTIDKEFTAAKLVFTVPAFPLPALIDQAGLGSVVRGTGRIAAHGEIVLQDGGFRKATVSASSLGELQLAASDRAAVSLDSMALAFTLGTGLAVRDIAAAARGRRLRIGGLAVEAPFSLDARGRQWPDLEFSIRDLQVARPLPLVAENISGNTAGPWAALRVNGRFRLRNGSGLLAALALPGELTRPYAVDGDFQGSLAQGGIAWTMQARGGQGLAVALGRDKLQGWLDLNASLKGYAQRLHASAACRLARADLNLAGYRARAGSVSGTAELDYAFAGDLQGRGLVRVSNGKLAAGAGAALQAAGIDLKLPWHWPGVGTGAAGGFAVASLQGRGMRCQDIRGVLSQQDAALVFSGSLRSALAAIVLNFQGRFAPGAGGGSLQADFTVPAVALPVGTALQPLHPLLAGMSGSGRFQASGRIWAGKGSVGGSAVASIADGDFERPKDKIALSGVSAEVRLVDLFAFVTAPAQRVGFKALRWQDMLFSDGELAFAAASDGALFIESARFVWCSGTVTLAPLRIKPGAGDLLLTFRCDRVNFAQMLNALVGKQIVSGDAEMSGIVPVRLVDGSPVFLDGTLLSTPGQSGNLMVSQPELISNGQVLVEEAIRDFRYNWIKVKLGGHDDLLDMVVSIDGAPARKLPLRYDAQQKDFVRDAAGGRHVELKGLLLDIRFLDIDLKDLLKASSQMSSRYQEK